MIPNGLLCHPAVFAVEDTYQILLLTDKAILASVIVGEKEYFYHSNGVRCSDTKTHRIIVPQTALDAAGSYTLRLCEAIERPAAFPVLGELQSYTYAFHPLTKTTNIRLYQVSDSHGHWQEAAAAVKATEQPDVLIFNGDVPNHCGNFDEMRTMLFVASEVTAGAFPCVCARGNHDLRGIYAEHLIDYMPHKNGLTYHTFRIGCIWGIILDCGEDKIDEHEAYGGTICCHIFREEQTEFLRTVEGYDAPGIKYRLVLSHNPFTHIMHGPFGIEVPLFTEWTQLLSERVKPHLMLSGHLHKNIIFREGCEQDNKDQPCPIIVTCRPGMVDHKEDDGGFTGAAITLTDTEAQVVCNDNNGVVAFEDSVALKQW